MRYEGLTHKTKTGIEETTAGTKKTLTKFKARGLAAILVAYGLVTSFLIMRWSGLTSATEQETNSATKKSTKR